MPLALNSPHIRNFLMLHNVINVAIFIFLIALIIFLLTHCKVTQFIKDGIILLLLPLNYLIMKLIQFRFAGINPSGFKQNSLIYAVLKKANRYLLIRKKVTQGWRGIFRVPLTCAEWYVLIIILIELGHMAVFKVLFQIFRQEASGLEAWAPCLQETSALNSIIVFYKHFLNIYIYIYMFIHVSKVLVSWLTDEIFKLQTFISSIQYNFADQV